MSKKLISILLPLLVLAYSAEAQNRKEAIQLDEGRKEVVEVTDTLTDAFLDSLEIKKDLKINDYTMIGVQYGVGLSQVMWNPKKEQRMMFVPINVGLTWTRYGKMFGYMPYFGIQAGIFYAREGYQLTQDPEKEGSNHVEGADRVIMDILEVPVLAHCHIDFWKMKLMINLGLYGGYRMSIKRTFLPQFNENPEYAHLWEWENKFKPTDNRFDFGIKGGVGIGFVFDPIEIHIQAMYKHSLSSLYQPDYNSRYYYKYAYPSNLIISAGIHFQLTKRVGKTKMQIKRQAKLDAYGKNEDLDRQGR